MRRKLTALLLAMTVFLVAAPFGAFAETDEFTAQGDQAVLDTAQDVIEEDAEEVQIEEDEVQAPEDQEETEEAAEPVVNTAPKSEPPAVETPEQEEELDEQTAAPLAGEAGQTALADFKAAAVGNKRGTNKIKLTWGAVDGASKYVITWSEDKYAEPIFNVSAGTATSFTKKIVVEDPGTYTFRIKALDAGGNTVAEAEAVGKIPNITVSKSGTTATTTDLKVVIPKGYKGKYKIVKVIGNTFKTVKIFENDGSKQTVNYTAKKLTSAKSYQFYVTNSATGVVSPKLTVKTAVANVTGFKTLSSAKAVILKWNKVPRATSYVITRTGGSGGKKTFTTTKLEFVDDTVAQDVMYDYAIKAKKSGFISSKTAAKKKGDAIRTMYLSIKFGTTRTLTSHTGGSVKATFAAGTVVTATGYTNGKYIFWYNGREYQVLRASISAASVKTLDTSRTYSGEEAMSYVNRMGLASSTPYLIWVNTYTQKLYIFKGSKGNWKIVQGPWLIASGKPTSPTSTGMTKIVDRMVSNGAPFWNVTYWFSLHGNARVWGNLGYPKSGACVRNTNEHAKWIFYNTPMYTAVYVF